MSAAREVLTGFLTVTLSALIVIGASSLSFAEDRFLAQPQEAAHQTETAATSSDAPGAAPFPILATQTPPPPAPSATTTIPPDWHGCQPPAGWQAYQVQPGETLLSLSQKFTIDLTTLIEANCLDSSTLIQAGSILYLPAAAAPTPTS